MGQYLWEGTEVPAVPFDWEYEPDVGENPSVARVLVPNFSDNSTAVSWLENMLLPSKVAVMDSLYNVLQQINEEPFPPQQKAEYYIPLEWLKPEIGSTFTNITDDGRGLINVQSNVDLRTAPVQLAYTVVLPGPAYERIQPALVPGIEWSDAIYAAAQGVSQPASGNAGQDGGEVGSGSGAQDFIYTSEPLTTEEQQSAQQFHFVPPFADTISNFVGLGAQIVHRTPWPVLIVGGALLWWVLTSEKDRHYH